MKKLLVKSNLIAILVLALAITGCDAKTLGTSTSVPEFSFSSVETGYPDSYDYDSADTAIITEVSTVNNTISLYNYELGKEYTLNVDKTSRFADKYNTGMSMSQVKVGQIADIIFLKSSKHLVQLKINDEAFNIEEISDYDINVPFGVFNYGTSGYKITSNTYIMKNGEQITYADLDTAGTLSIRGFDDVIEVIEVTSSVGTIKVTGAGYFEGGYLEIASNNIVAVTNEMEIEVPEGEYELRISHNTDEGTIKVLVEDGKTTIADFSGIEVKESNLGKVTINVVPEGASITIDSKTIKAGREYKFTYGLHNLTVSADGYDTQMRFVNVGETPIVLDVELKEIVVEEDETSTLVSENGTNSSSVSNNEINSVSGN